MTLDLILGRMTAEGFSEVHIIAGDTRSAYAVSGGTAKVLTGLPVMDEKTLLVALYPLATPERWDNFIASQSEPDPSVSIPERNVLFTQRTLNVHRTFGSCLFKITVTFSGELRAHFRLLPDT